MLLLKLNSTLLVLFSSICLAKDISGQRKLVAKRLVPSEAIERKGYEFNAIAMQDYLRHRGTLPIGIALGAFLLENGPLEGDLERFALLASGTYGFPVVPHGSFAAVGLASKAELPNGIEPGSHADIHYEEIFRRILDRALEGYKGRRNHPVIFFNLSGLSGDRSDTLTARELELILRTRRFLERTLFFLNNVPVDQEIVRTPRCCHKIATFLKRL